MRLLFCCQWYAPSVGGVQEVIRQVAERLAARGHEVTVATAADSRRGTARLNGVEIAAFRIAGNLVEGLSGEVAAYRRFVRDCGADVVTVKAAQQWSLDGLLPELEAIRAGKVFIPCGFSGLHEPAYRDYYRRMPEILRRFDHLIFYASDYRDIRFAKQHGLTHWSLIPNGADEREFGKLPEPGFRRDHGIGEAELLFLTVGSLTGLKGHGEVLQAFEWADWGKRPATLILNGNVPRGAEDLLAAGRRLRAAIRSRGWAAAAKKAWSVVLDRLGCAGLAPESLPAAAERLHRAQPEKRVLLTDLPRAELIRAYFAADLFVFASQVEYSPLVLFEAAAAGTPFLSGPVGNAEEIAGWTGAGTICPALADERGYVRVDPAALARQIADLARDPRRLAEMGAAGRKNWEARFTWEKITLEYERVLLRAATQKLASSP